MIRIDKLMEMIEAHNLTLGEVADYLHLKPKVLEQKLVKCVLSSQEIEALIRLLSIENPEEIFFFQK